MRNQRGPLAGRLWAVCKPTLVSFLNTTGSQTLWVTLGWFDFPGINFFCLLRLCYTRNRALRGKLLLQSQSKVTLCVVFRLFSFGRRKLKKIKKESRRQTSNISQHQERYPYFASAVCAEGRRGKRGKRSGERQLTHRGARLAGSRKVGNRVRWSRWQWATWRSMRQQALAAVPVLAPPGRMQHARQPCCPSPGRWLGHSSDSISQPDSTYFYLAPWLLLLLRVEGNLMCYKNCLEHVQTLMSSLMDEYKTLPPYFLAQAKPLYFPTWQCI